MQDARAGGHPLRVAGTQEPVVAHRVAVLEVTLEEVRDGLEPAVRVPRRAGSLAGTEIDGAHVVEEQERIDVGQRRSGERPRTTNPSPSMARWARMRRVTVAVVVDMVSSFVAYTTIARRQLFHVNGVRGRRGSERATQSFKPARTCRRDRRHRTRGAYTTRVNGSLHNSTGHVSTSNTPGDVSVNRAVAASSSSVRGSANTPRPAVPIPEMRFPTLQ